MINELVENDQYVADLRRALRAGIGGIEDVPKTLRIILERGMWQRRFDRTTQQEVGFDSFAQFVTTHPTEGLGTSVEMVRNIIRDDAGLLDLMDQAEQRPSHRPIETGNNIPSSGRPEGTSPEKALRRLRKDRPDLHAQVVAGEMSPHAAAVAAGFRKRTLTVPLSVTGFARAIQRHLTVEERVALVRVLLSEGTEA